MKQLSLFLCGLILWCNAKSLEVDSTRTSRFNYKVALVPAALMVSGVLLNSNNPESVKNEIVGFRNNHMPNFRAKIDDYLQFSPIAMAYGLDAMGINSKNTAQTRSFLLLKGEVLAIGSSFLLKNLCRQVRPDGSGFNSFPSGHTTQAFAAATFLSEEYKDRYPWVPYAAYGVAASVGALRMANNKHYISDVLFGAGLGILAMKTPYWLKQKKHHPLPQW